MELRPAFVHVASFLELRERTFRDARANCPQNALGRMSRTVLVTRSYCISKSSDSLQTDKSRKHLVCPWPHLESVLLLFESLKVYKMVDLSAFELQREQRIAANKRKIEVSTNCNSSFVIDAGRGF